MQLGTKETKCMDLAWFPDCTAVDACTGLTGSDENVAVQKR